MEKSDYYKGKFNIPNLSEENDAKDIDVSILKCNTETYCANYK